MGRCHRGLRVARNDISAAIDRKKAEAVERALDIYYDLEEASRDPENAHLIGQVEEMRAAFERDCGRPIPPKGKR